jgi:hypothetical protein
MNYQYLGFATTSSQSRASGNKQCPYTHYQSPVEGFSQGLLRFWQARSSVKAAGQLSLLLANGPCSLTFI